jgi:hypothetical protein
MFKEIIAVYSENLMKLGKILAVQAGGTYSCQQILSG